MNTFYKEKMLSEYFGERKYRLAQEVEKLSEYQMSFPLETIAEELSKRYSISPLAINFDERTSRVVMIPVEGRRMDVTYMGPKTIEVARVIYTFKYAGDKELMRCQPSNSSMGEGIGVDISNTDFTIGYLTKYYNENLSDQVKDEVKSNMSRLVNNLKIMTGKVNEEVEAYNTTLREFALGHLQVYHEKLERKSKQNSDLNSF